MSEEHTKERATEQNGSPLGERLWLKSMNVYEENKGRMTKMIIPPGQSIEEWKRLRWEVFILEEEKIQDDDAHE